jgi:iron complex outermembrane receptor protein
MAYASFNTGYKSGGYSMIPPDPNAYFPETLKAWEVGLKAELFDRRVRWNTAGFWYNWDNLQVTVYRNTSAVTVNAAKARMYGIDSDFAAQLSDYFTLSGGIAWLEDKFTSYPNAPLIIPQSAAQGGGNLAGVTDATGNRLPYAPGFTGSLSGDLKVPLGKSELSLNATYYHNSGYYTTPDNVLRQEAYDLLNARIGWTAPDGRTTIAIWGKNLTDKRYSTQLRGNVGPGSMTVQVLAPPRTYGVSARYQF